MRGHYTELVIRPLSAERCPGLQDLALTWANASLRMAGRTHVVMDIDAVFSRPASQLKRLCVWKVACSEAVSSNTCSHPMEWNFSSNVCRMLTLPHMPWTPILQSMQPSLKCPIESGNYSGHNIAFDTSIAKVFGGESIREGYVHVVKGTLFDQDNRPFACLQVTADIIRIKKRADN
ncbi:Putative phosphatidylglycerol/phosphatidylinositol transfer protein 3 [Frankliniella fusca]|uniref:Phosphatidylglycerol/phosphatidylinositol transfer protein 3 n=1 Tax=Frankliniella fusca TaxID=407009 RepID=A0AAE1HXP1_9NEOP|nr:Putative phosphatidylglycerol/phosphatidylinositol transfer protein 3 [Frankliniella fusca]